MTTFDPGMLSGPQRRLWNALGDTPADFVLYGGTALALGLRHRESVHFDFFSRTPFAPEDLRMRIGYLKAARTLRQSENTLTCVVDREGDVHVSYFGGLEPCSVHEPDRAEGTGIFVASLLDLAATKVATAQARADARDYFDIDALLRAGVTLEDALGAAGAAYGSGFNPLLSLKALTFFGEGDLDTVPTTVRDRLAAAVAAVDLKRLPTSEPQPWLRRS